MHVRRMRALFGLASVLTLIGAINWGLVGLFRFNLVRRLLGCRTRAERAVYAAVGISGTLLAVVFALPMALVALGARRVGREAARGHPIIGETMPSISGTTLSGHKVTIPQDTRGKVSCLVMGFAYDARFDVEDWVEALRNRFGQNPDVVLYEVPVISRWFRLMAPMIDEGMRRGTPTAMHDRIVTVYANPGPLREALGASPISDTWVYLLDRDGRVVFQYGGPFDEQRFSELASAVESTLARGEAGGQRAA